MKKIFFTIACVSVGSMSYAQVINSFPFVEDFESQATGPTGCGPTYATTGNTWRNGDDAVPAIATHFVDWTNNIGGTSSSNTGPSIDHTLGTTVGKYMYCETSCSGTGYTNSEFDLVSPYMNFTTLTAPVLDFWYHAFGTTMGNLTVKVQVGALGVWTNVAGPNTGNLDAWQQSTIPLVAYAGMDSVRIQMNYISGTSFGGDFALDDISIFQPSPVDIEAVSVDSIPVTGCGLGFENVWATISQNGATGLIAGDTIFANYSDGTTTINDTIVLAGALGPAAIYNHMFSSPVDFSVPGIYNITVSVFNSLDASNANDTTYASVNNVPIINTFPYAEGFEAGAGGWAMTNVANSTWELTTPSNAIINSAAAGSMSWVTNATGLYNSNEDGYVQGPCFDFSALDSSAVISLDVWWESEFSWDGANITASTDGGATWNLVGNNGDPTNWYTDNTINGNPGGFQEGWTGRNGVGSNGWVTAHLPIGNGLAGQSSVMLRVNFGSDGSVQDEGFAFDNFQIGYPVPLDTLMADYNGCGPFMTAYGSTGTYAWASQDTTTLIVTPIDTTMIGIRPFNNTGLTVTTFNLIVTFTDYLGCETIDTTLVTIAPTPLVTIEVDTTICIGGTAIFSAQAGANYAYLWSGGATTMSSTYSTAGMIGVTVTDIISGCTVSDSSLITFATVVDLPMTTANVCAGDSLVLDAGLFTTYMWSTGATSQVIAATSVGTYVVTATDSIGCVSMDSTVITTSMPTPAITGLIDTICANGSMMLDAGAGFSSYSWTTSGTAQTEMISGASLPLGDNTVTVTVTDGNGCSNTDAVTFNIDGCAGIDELNAFAMSIYPNPSTGEFNYSIDNMAGSITMMITDLSGKIVDAGTITSASGIFDLSRYQAGTYILKLQAGDTVSIVRLVKN
ncbi:MAG: T9SS type A sorting domain-containing protein [Fluviicola sp.]|nr:T9SS type A sorting domain-containing protein [Fluviicola sp.]